jgi:hypothetical protein
VTTPAPTPAERAAAVQAAAKASGVPADMLVRQLVMGHELSPYEAGAVLAELRASAPAPAPATPDPAVNAAVAAAETEQRRADVVAFAAYQRMRAENPFHAAQYRLANAASIERGETITTDSEPPTAA